MIMPLREGKRLDVVILVQIKKFVIFSFIFFILFFFMNHIFEDKEAKKNLYAIRYEPKDTIDVIFLGNSHANNAFLPMELYKEYGYTAYSMSQMSQSFPLVYYCAEDAIKLQHPRLLVVDLFAATSYENDFPLMHVTMDNLTFGTRMQAIDEFVPREKRTEYQYPFYLYHDRWADLNIKDILPYFMRYSPDRNCRKGAALVSDWTVCDVPDRAIEASIQHSEYTELSGDALYWYNRIKNLCNENGTELLFVVVPYYAPVGCGEDVTFENIKLYNATEQWCENNGVKYLNLFRNLDEMNFDFATDMQDVSHVNVLGAEKVTLAVGKYINANYDIENSHNNVEISSKWDKYYDSYYNEKITAIANCGGMQE